MNDSPCNGCKRPQKCPTCHIGCPEFVAWEIVHNAMRESYSKQRRIADEVYAQRSESVRKAFKRKKGIK